MRIPITLAITLLIFLVFLSPVIAAGIIHIRIINPYCKKKGYFLLESNKKDTFGKLSFYRDHAKHPVLNWAVAYEALALVQFLVFVALGVFR